MKKRTEPGFLDKAAAAIRRSARLLTRGWQPSGNGGDDGADRLEPTIYRFVLRHSLRDQVFLVILTLVSFPFLYYSLDLPKTIVNRAIGGKHFPQKLLWWEFDQIPYLAIMCGVFLAMVVINGWFKYYINVKKGQTGERMLRRLRYELYWRILRFPAQHFSRTSTGELIAMVTAELEPVGGFIGDAFALPVFQGGTLLTILVFMFVQDPVLGGAAVALYPIQGYVIPKLQRKVRALGRERVRKMRKLSDRIGESIAARVDIHVNDHAPYQLADVSARLGTIYDIRFEIYNRKFFVKFLNNFIGQLTPFFFYAIGGYLVIAGNLSFGALVAVLAAYKDLSSPWKELLDFYQQQQDVAIKYEQVVEQFQVPAMLDPKMQLDEPERIEPLSGEIVAANVTLADIDGAPLVQGVSFSAPLGEHLALVGPSNSGKDELATMLARVVVPTAGRITIGGQDINTLPVAVTGRRIGYVGPVTTLFAESVRDNLLIGLRHRPLSDSVADRGDASDAERRARKHALVEAHEAGNIDYDIAADWIDYAQAGVEDEAGLRQRIREVLTLVELEADVHAMGLRGRLDPARQPDAAERLIEARRELDARLAGSDLARCVERFDPQRYNRHATIAENLLFGTPVGRTFADEHLPRQSYVRRVLDETGLAGDLLRVGSEIAGTMVELFGDLRADHEFFEQFSFVSAEDLPAVEAILGRLEKSEGPASLPKDDREMLLSLAFKIVVARHRLDLIDDALQERIVEVRHRFAEGLPEDLRDAIEFFDPDEYNSSATLEENVLFGKVAATESADREHLRELIAEVLDALGLHDLVIETGLGYHVGTGGSRLSPAQRQKVAIGRAVLKRPDLLVLNEATAVLDGPSQNAVLDGVRREFEGRGIVWSLHRAGLARNFHRVLVMSGGMLAEQGTFDELEAPEGTIAQLMAAE
ncbi:MAG TPA: ABC transporter ATP-binding protein [Stellaceae bacterium]